jgi:hypothetical protein
LNSPSWRLKSDSDSVSQPPQRGDPQIPVDGATNQLVAKFSRLYAQAAREDQLVLRLWMRDIIMGRRVGSANTAGLFPSIPHDSEDSPRRRHSIQTIEQSSFAPPMPEARSTSSFRQLISRPFQNTNLQVAVMK